MSNLATITNNILADSGIDDINVVVTTGSYANPAWITSLAWTKITGAPLGDYLPLAGGTMTGNVNWAQTDRGLTWVFNTDGASIKFYNTGDGDADSRLEFATLDNGNEYFRWVHIPSGAGSAYESMRLIPNNSGNAELIVTGKIIKSGGTTSQFLKANGDVDSTSYQPLLTNPVTGSGTTSYLPRFTGASTIGDSALNSNGSGVGIYELAYQGVDVNSSVQVILQLTNTRYNSSNATGENKLGFGWGNHFAAGISAYKATVNTTGFKFYTEVGFNTPVLKMTLTPDGNLLVGPTTDAGYKLDVSGTGRFSSSVTATSFFESSDARLKSNIIDLEVDMRSIVAKHYTKNGIEEIGYLAQDVEEILPSAISKRDDGYLDLSYRQVHTAKIAYLEKRITELEQQLKNK